jgi:hypothetical protein
VDVSGYFFKMATAKDGSRKFYSTEEVLQFFGTNESLESDSDALEEDESEEEGDIQELYQHGVSEESSRSDEEGPEIDFAYLGDESQNESEQNIPSTEVPTHTSNEEDKDVR